MSLLLGLPMVCAFGIVSYALVVEIHVAMGPKRVPKNPIGNRKNIPDLWSPGLCFLTHGHFHYAFHDLLDLISSVDGPRGLAPKAPVGKATKGTSREREGGTCKTCVVF